MPCNIFNDKTTFPGSAGRYAKKGKNYLYSYFYLSDKNIQAKTDRYSNNIPEVLDPSNNIKGQKIRPEGSSICLNVFLVMTYSALAHSFYLVSVLICFFM